MPTTLTPEERRLRAELAAHTMHSRHNPTDTTSKAREAFLKRFELEVDPEGTLPLPERKRRAESARKAYFTRLAFQRTRKGGGINAE